MDMRSKLGNPWMPDEWNLTRQGEFIKLYGEGRARVFAKVAKTTLGGLKPSAMAVGDTRTFIYTKRLVTNDGSGGGIIGAGSSGEGPPE